MTSQEIKTMIHLFQLKAYYGIKGAEVEVYKEDVKIAGECFLSALKRAKQVFKIKNIDCFACPEKRIKVVNYKIN